MKLCKIGKLNLARAFAFLTVLCVVMFWGIDAYAEEGNNGQDGNTYTSSSIYDGLGIEANTKPKMNVDSLASAYAITTGGSYNNVRGQGAYQYGSAPDSIFDHTVYLDSVTLNNTTVNFDDTCGFFNFVAYPQEYYWSCRVSGNGHICLSGKNDRSNPYVLSDQEFTVGYVINYGSSVGTVGIVVVNTPDVTSGLYIWHPWGNDAYTTISNMNIYLPSTDGYSGFTNENFSDLSFANENYDFNSLLHDGLVVPPASPAPNPYENDKYYLNFDDTTYYSGGALTSFFHANNFSFNQYVLNNPVNYRLKFEYVATVKRNNTTYTFTYNPDPIQLAYFLGQSSRFGTGSRLYVPLSTDWFVDGYGHTMSAFLKGCVTDVYGTTSNYANPNDVLETDSEIVLDPYYIFRTDEYIQKSLPKVNSAFAFQDFTIDGYVNLYTNDDSNYESYSYHDSYNWATGKSDVVSTQNNTPPYEEEGVNNNTSIVPNSNGGGPNYNAGSINPQIDVTVHTGSNYPWTPYTLDEISYGNVKDMFNDIKDFIDSTSSNSFWQVLDRTFSYIPDKIWQYITITIAVICGFAVVRYVLRR